MGRIEPELTESFGPRPAAEPAGGRKKLVIDTIGSTGHAFGNTIGSKEPLVAVADHGHRPGLSEEWEQHCFAPDLAPSGKTRACRRTGIATEHVRYANRPGYHAGAQTRDRAPPGHQDDIELPPAEKAIETPAGRVKYSRPRWGSLFL